MIDNIIRPAVKNCRDYIPGKPVEEVQRELGIEHVDKMASNENPLGTSPKALEAMRAELFKSNRYPESGCTELVAKLAAKHNVPKDWILVGNGLDDVITMIGMTVLDPGDESVYGDATFPAYGNITRKMGGKCVEVRMTDKMENDLDGLLAAMTERTKMVGVCNPNNPTGTIVDKDALLAFIEKVPSHVLIVMDEAYYDFAHSDRYMSMLDEVKNHENLVVLRTFSKVYGLAAERIGYMIGNPAIIRAVSKVRQPFPVNRIAQAGALAALDDQEFYENTLKVNLSGLHQYQQAFDEMGLKYYDSQTNFIYVEIPKDAAEVFNTMLHDGIIIRPQKLPGYPDALRISIGTADENERTIRSLKKALA